MNKTTAQPKYPEWVEKLIEPGTEVHIIGGRYYLYKYTYEYNKETKRHKKLSTFVGRLVENIGLVPKGSNVNLPRKPRTRKRPLLPKVTDNMEYGISYWMNKKVEPIYYKLVSDHFGICWQTIIAIAFCRLVFQSSMRDMLRHFNNSFLSIMLPDAIMDDNYIRETLRYIGRNREQQIDFFNEFSSTGNIVIFDGTTHESQSQKMYLPQYTKLKDGSFGYGINIVNGFSTSKQLPSYIRCIPGDIKDIKAIELCIKEFPNKGNVTALFDKGFFSEKNINMLNKSGIIYIMPLKRNSMGKDGIDYGVLNQQDKEMKLFMFESRSIQCCEVTQLYGSHVYLYLDDELQYKENHDARVRLNEKLEIIAKKREKIQARNEKAEKKKLRKEKKKFSNKPAEPDMDNIEIEEYTGQTEKELWAEYFEKEKKFGTILLITNGQKGPEETYIAYKSRDQVEKMIDVMKNVLDEDVSHMQDQDVYNGWMFCNFIALHWYYLLRNMLVESEEIKHFSPQNILTELGYHQIVKINGEWNTVERTKKKQELLNKLGLEVKYPYA